MPSNDIAVADKVSDKSILRFIVNILRRSDLLDIALIHNNDRVGHGQCLFLVMCDINKGNAQAHFSDGSARTAYPGAALDPVHRVVHPEAALSAH